MPIFLLILLAIQIILVACIVFLLAVIMPRNENVYDFRIKLIDEVSSVSKLIIASGGEDYGLAWDWYHSLPGYDNMLAKFWIPLDRFVPVRCAEWVENKREEQIAECLKRR